MRPQICRNLLGLAAAALAWTGAAFGVPLQPLVDRTPAGGTLVLAPGRYEGPVRITRPIAIDGSGRAALVGNGGRGTVFTVEADGVTLRDLTIAESGASHDQVDAGILLLSSRNRIVGNLIRDTLFGIDLKASHENLIEGNRISSKPFELGLRGDAIRVWASHRNRIRGNLIHDSRDLVVWYSNDNLIEDNLGRNNRYSVHFMYGIDNDVRSNEFRHNSVGISLMYSRNTRVTGNRIINSLGAAGTGIGLKQASAITVSGNRIVYCAIGIHVDQSPMADEGGNRIEGNEIAYNMEGIVFHSELEGNLLRGNRFLDNLRSVIVAGNGTALGSRWEGNYWSDYVGFDRDRDGIGDSPYRRRLFLDQLWTAYPAVKFFYGSPVLTFLDYLARLAPFSEPRLILEDRRPLFRYTPIAATGGATPAAR
ncbi:MAG: nitrous oxide reductase family maturation protein NosD [Candidatus Lambdaproteobacteria bacterium]|nr:nitrous oxide reductase family maturation protein NosD [Candidatus Lambdaproteobacteria bacterium]